MTTELRTLINTLYSHLKENFGKIEYTANESNEHSIIFKFNVVRENINYPLHLEVKYKNLYEDVVTFSYQSDPSGDMGISYTCSLFSVAETVNRIVNGKRFSEEFISEKCKPVQLNAINESNSTISENMTNKEKELVPLTTFIARYGILDGVVLEDAQSTISFNGLSQANLFELEYIAKTQVPNVEQVSILNTPTKQAITLFTE
jgi:hypothetical protein